MAPPDAERVLPRSFAHCTGRSCVRGLSQIAASPLLRRSNRVAGAVVTGGRDLAVRADAVRRARGRKRARAAERQRAPAEVRSRRDIRHGRPLCTGRPLRASTVPSRAVCSGPTRSGSPRSRRATRRNPEFRNWMDRENVQIRSGSFSLGDPYGWADQNSHGAINRDSPFPDDRRRDLWHRMAVEGARKETREAVQTGRAFGGADRASLVRPPERKSMTRIALVVGAWAAMVLPGVWPRWF